MKNLVKYMGRVYDTEYEFNIEINGVKLLVFSILSIPFMMYTGQEYLVELSFLCIDDLVEEMPTPKYGIEKIPNDYFGYYLYGKLEGNILDLGKFKIEDHSLFSCFPNLNGKFIKVLVDRINVKFFER